MAEKIRLAYIISDIDKALPFEWLAQYVSAEKFDLHFILLNPGDSQLEQFLKTEGLKVSRVTYRGKRDSGKAFWQTYRLLRRYKIEVVHTHLFTAAMIGLLAARLAGIKKRINTRHHATQNYEYYRRAVYYDKIINRLATHILAISNNVRQVLLEMDRVPAHKVHLVSHGFKLEIFEKVEPAAIASLAEKYSTKGHFPVLGVIARYSHLKGYQYVLPAFEQLLEVYPNALLLMANARGDYKREVGQMLAKIPTQHYRELLFESDLPALYQLLDIYTHVPINAQIEAFGQTYVEALAAGIPSVFTLSGIANEFIKHEQNALVVPYQDSTAIYQAWIRLLEDEPLRKKMIENGRQDVAARFGLPNYIQKLENLYQIAPKAPHFHKKKPA
ncbi:MAG: glycosyltransferase family 4 protein [Microscillaceae bacterium]